MFAAQSQFVTSASDPATLPVSELPEIAFAGRSNVGKSSLLNALLHRKSLVKTSKTPGRTRLLNFFTLGQHLYLVDMPGYGYAKAPKNISQNWPKLIERYFRERRNLRIVCLLIDCRRGLMQSDQQLMQTLKDAAVPYLLILTKCDKLVEKKISHTQNTILKILAQSAAAYPYVLRTSTNKYQGFAELRALIAKIIAPSTEI